MRYFFKKQGFTFLELLVVLVIISLMSALVAPRLGGALSRMNSKTAAKKIAASLRYARSQAVSRKMPHIAVFDFDKNRIVIGNWKPETPGTGNWELGTGNRELEAGKIYDLPEGVKLESAIGGEVVSGLFQINFYPVGSSSGGGVIISDEQERLYKITVDFITGTVQLNAEQKN
ncbi:GspH/FimT family pseudopilin [Desulfonema magnum]|uniref:Type II secretion system protein H n=1 Tax=Desulfonema magnum TaxID=45655 RepID=A0A975GKF8_9BACT|nr:GspH/FimT family pseudopilin [Desulfonema magnum]QTA84704.1 Type II secretion system protein, GspH-like [Desulfonema magnum]